MTDAVLGIDVFQEHIRRYPRGWYKGALQELHQFVRWLASADCLARRAQNRTGSRLSGGNWTLRPGHRARTLAGYVVSIVNPAQIRNFARTKLGRNKTDQVDAVHIREYAELFKPRPWIPPSPAMRRLCTTSTPCGRDCPLMGSPV